MEKYNRFEPYKPEMLMCESDERTESWNRFLMDFRAIFESSTEFDMELETDAIECEECDGEVKGKLVATRIDDGAVHATVTCGECRAQTEFDVCGGAIDPDEFLYEIQRMLTDSYDFGAIIVADGYTCGECGLANAKVNITKGDEHNALHIVARCDDCEAIDDYYAYIA